MVGPQIIFQVADSYNAARLADPSVVTACGAKEWRDELC